MSTRCRAYTEAKGVRHVDGLVWHDIGVYQTQKTATSAKSFDVRQLAMYELNFERRMTSNCVLNELSPTSPRPANSRI